MDVTTPTAPYNALGGVLTVYTAWLIAFARWHTELTEANAVCQRQPESLFDCPSGWFGGASLHIAKKEHPCLWMRSRGPTTWGRASATRGCCA